MAYIKLNREIADSGIFADIELLGFYVKLVMLCRTTSVFEGGLEIKRGEFKITVRRIAELFDCSVQHARTNLNKLQRAKLIGIKTNTRFSIITVINYDCQEGFWNSSTNESTQNAANGADDVQQAGNTASLSNLKIKNFNLLAPRAQNKYDQNSLEPESESKIDRNVPDRQRLVDKFGEANVADYEQRFELWRARQKRSVGIPRYAAIERWMREDGVTKPQESSFNTDEIMRRIVESYGGSE